MTPQPQLGSSQRALLLIWSLSGLRKSSWVESQRGRNTTWVVREKLLSLLFCATQEHDLKSLLVMLNQGSDVNNRQFSESLELKNKLSQPGPTSFRTHCSDSARQWPAFPVVPSQGWYGHGWGGKPGAPSILYARFDLHSRSHKYAHTN